MQTRQMTRVEDDTQFPPNYVPRVQCHCILHYTRFPSIYKLRLLLNLDLHNGQFLTIIVILQTFQRPTPDLGQPSTQ